MLPVRWLIIYTQQGTLQKIKCSKCNVLHLCLTASIDAGMFHGISKLKLLYAQVQTLQVVVTKPNLKTVVFVSTTVSTVNLYL